MMNAFDATRNALGIARSTLGATRSALDPDRVRPWAVVFLSAFALLLGGGCGDGSSSGDGTTSGGATVVRDTLPSGVERVVSTPPATPGWTLVEELRVGTAGEGPESFTRLKGLAVLDDGRFAVLESASQELRVFGPDGAHLATHGRRGEGPGEFQSANGLMLAPDGRLWVPDERARRVSVFDAADGFVDSFRFETSVIHWVWEGRMASDGRIFYPAEEGESPEQRNVLRVYDQTMTETASLPMPGDTDFATFNQHSAFCWTTRGGTACYSVPWYPREVAHIDPSGAVWSTAVGNPDFRIAKWTPGGDTAFAALVERAPVPVSAAERDSAAATVRELAPEGATVDPSRIPDVKPLVQDIFTSAEGNAWVRVRLPGVESAFDVLAPDGGLLRTVTWDARLDETMEPVARGDFLWAVVADDLGVQYVVKARVSPAPGAGAGG